MSGFLTWRDRLIAPPGVDATIALLMTIAAVVLAGIAYYERQQGNAMPIPIPTATIAAALVLALGLASIQAGRIDALTLNSTARMWPAFQSCHLRSEHADLDAVPGCARNLPDAVRRRPDHGLHSVRDVSRPLRRRPVHRRSAFTLDRHDRRSAGVRVRRAAGGAHVSALTRRPARRASVHVERSQFRRPPGTLGRTVGLFEAEHVRFVGPDLAIVLSDDHGGATVREIALDQPPAIVREHRFEDLAGPGLIVNSDSRRWGIVGWNGRDIVSAESDGEGGLQPERRWTIHEESDYLTPVALTPLGSDPSGPIVLETLYDPPPTMLWRLRMAAAMAPVFNGESRLWRVSAEGREDLLRSRLDVNCSAYGAAGRAMCTAFDGRRTRFLTVGPDAAVDPMAMLPGQFIEMGRTSDGWITGWWNRRATALRLDTGEAFQVAPEEGQQPSLLAPADGLIGALSYEPGRQVVRLYRLH